MTSIPLGQRLPPETSYIRYINYNNYIIYILNAIAEMVYNLSSQFAKLRITFTKN